MMFNTAGKVITCRAAVAWEERKPLTIEEIQVAVPRGSQVRIKICFTTVCQTDIFFGDGGHGDIFPCILGHEGSGIVESVGEDVSNLKPGDHVLPLCVPQCKECKFCLNGETNVCDKFSLLKSPDKHTGLSCRGVPLKQILGTGTFSEYTLVDEISIAKVRDDAPLDKISVLSCGFATGFGAVSQSCKVLPGSRVAIWGMNAFGLAALLGAKACGASQIVAIDSNAAKLAQAKKLGATDCINPRESPNSGSFPSFLTKTFDGGFDFTFACAGVPAAVTQAFEAAHEGWGVACVVGFTDKEVPIISMNLMSGRTLKGSLFGGWKTRDDIPKLVDSYLAGNIDLDALVTHKMDLPGINNAFNLLRLGQW